MEMHHAKGFTLVETSIVLGIMSILAVSGLACLDFGGADLVIAQEDLRGSIQQAFFLARARGSNVVVTLGNPGMPDVLPVMLPRTVKWGKPTGIPVPPGMDEPKKAGLKGEAHPRITITPRHTATASAWFVNNGKEAICMRLSGKGHLQMLRWRRSTRRWSLV
jgi:prepilin-type N-terminal cleavage/methylation domain-containing protein